MTATVIALGLTVAALLGERAYQRRQLLDMIALVDRMAQRLQAPSAAVLEHDERVRGPVLTPPGVPPDDDEAFWESRDALAETLMAQEVRGGDA